MSLEDSEKQGHNIEKELESMSVRDDNSQQELEPRKVFIGNLGKFINEKCLYEALSDYATVKKVLIIRDKITKCSKGYGFVTVAEPEDVEQLLQLEEGNFSLKGKRMVIQHAKKRSLLRSSKYQPSLPERDFDLAYTDPNLPSFHMLIDDVIYKIFEYLSLRELLYIERVCRRWQMLVHAMFTKVYKLDIDPKALGINTIITRSLVTKLLSLTGPTLKELKVQRGDNATRANILAIIGQLCPVLERLDISMLRGVNFRQIYKLGKDCKNLKAFIAENCLEFKENSLSKLLNIYPGLEVLNVSRSFVSGKCFNRLPATLKELHLSYCYNVYAMELYSVGDCCPNLEVLEIKSCNVNSFVLEHIGSCCPKLTQLSVYMDEFVANEVFKDFKNLKELNLECNKILQLSYISKNMPCLQKLSVSTNWGCTEELDFSHLKDLRCIDLYQVCMEPESLTSLAKCTKLEEIIIDKCREYDNSCLLVILTECKEMKTMHFPNTNLTVDFINSVNKIMENRSGKLVCRMYAELFSDRYLENTKYDRSKIQFETICDEIDHEDFLDDYEDYLVRNVLHDCDDSDYSEDEHFNEYVYGLIDEEWVGLI